MTLYFILQVTERVPASLEVAYGYAVILYYFLNTITEVIEVGVIVSSVQVVREFTYSFLSPLKRKTCKIRTLTAVALFSIFMVIIGK